MIHKKPIIGITAMSSPEPDGFDPIIGIDRPYLESIESAGGSPLIIPYLCEHDDLKSAFNLCDGFLFPGGKDVTPRLYLEESHPKLGEVDYSQDHTEIELIKLCIEKKKPLIGICRGLQIINVAMGGTLYQDLPSQNPSSINHSYSATPMQFRTLVHTIKIGEGAKLSKILGTNQIGVNSSHHQAIKKLADGLVVSAVSEDNIIEAIELPNHPFMVAVQGHPEVLWQESEKRWKLFFQSFIEQTNRRFSRSTK